MRLGLDIGKAVSGGDGVGRFGEQLLRSLVRREDREVELVLTDLGGSIGESDVRARFPELEAVAWRFVESLSACEVDVFYALTWRWPAGLAAPVLFALYDVTFLTRPEHHTADNRANCLEGTLRALVGDASFVTISHAAAGAIRDWLGTPEDRLHVVPLAAAPDFSPVPPEEAAHRVRERWGLEPGFVLSVGTLEPRKNHRRLLEAWRRLPEATRARSPLVLAGGRGWKSEELTEQPDLRWLGRISDAELLDLYGIAGVFAYPSLEEGFGLPILEAMACGLPVLTSSVSSLPEVAGEAAVLVDPTDVEAIADGLRRILDDDSTRRDLAARGLARCAEFSWDRVAADTLVLCGEVADRARVTGGARP